MTNETVLEATIEEFLTAIRQAGLSEATYERYGWHLQRMKDWLLAREITDPQQFDKKVLRKWGASLYEYTSSRTGQGWAPATIKQGLAAVRSFLNWCRTEEIIDQNLAEVLKMPKIEKEPQRTLDLAEAWTVIQACDPSTKKGMRDRALIALLLDSGLRASEFCRLQLDDIQFDMKLYDPVTGTVVKVNRIVMVRKGGTRKPLFFGPETADWIRDWVEVRKGVARSGVKELFVSVGGIKPGTRITRDGLRVIVRKLAKQAGVDHFSPHALRRSFACFLDEAGASTRNIQLLGGWSNIKEVETYTQGLNAGRQYARYNPVGFLRRIAQLGDGQA